jgi:hypothetical protein
MFKPALLAAVVALALGSVTAPSMAASGVVSIRVGPPPQREEVMPEPRRGHVWVPGYWDWSQARHRHHWVAGYWVRSRQGYVYAPPHWVDRGGRWEMRRGTWARGDLDRDGVRNGQDRDRDGDGVPNRRDQAPDNPRRN